MKHVGLTERIIGAAIEVHNLLGPGFLESIYQQALVHELIARDLSVSKEVGIRITYKDHLVGRHRLDVVVNGLVIVELKACHISQEVVLAQALSYLRATDLEVALVFNFGEPKLSWKRIIRDRIPSVSSV